MSRLLLKLAIAATGSLVSSNPTVAQVLPPAQKAAHVEITQGPALELARDDLAIIRWTTNNPGGSDDHFGVVYYGTDPKHLSQMAKSHIRLNRGLSETVFRVRVGGLQSRTTYYYTVTSTESNGKSDGWRALSTSSPHPAPASESCLTLHNLYRRTAWPNRAADRVQGPVESGGPTSR